ncbi:MAG TPA: fatty acyl-AMP ligase [Rugosimonospora sp.]
MGTFHSLLSAVRDRAATHPEAAALTVVTDPDAGVHRTLSYGELDRRGRAVAAGLCATGKPGDRVVLALPTGEDFATALLGCWYAGFVAVPAPPPGRPGEIDRIGAIAEDCAAAVVLTDVSLSTMDFQPAMRPAAEDIALLQYTSGSTGDPHGVVLTHGNLAHNLAGIWTAFGRPGTVRIGGWLPLYHDMGLAMLLMPWWVGGTSILMPPSVFLRRPHRWLRMVDRYDIQISAGPDFAYALCARQLTDAQVDGLDLSRWTAAISGAEPVSAATVAAFTHRLAPAGFRPEALSPCYGLAESTVYVTGAGAGPPTVRAVDAAALADRRLVALDPVAGTGGRALVGCGTSGHLEVRVVDPDTGRPLAAGHIGEIWIRGGSVAGGYWNRPARSRAVFTAVTTDGEPGWLRSGDLGAMLDGELFVTGRAKDTIVVYGRTLYPHDIEATVRATAPQLATLFGAAFGFHGSGGDIDSTGGERIAVVHELQGRPEPADLRALAGRIRSRVAAAHGVALHGVVLVRPGAVPRTTSGKVRRSATRDLALAGALSPLYTDLPETAR